MTDHRSSSLQPEQQQQQPSSRQNSMFPQSTTTDSLQQHQNQTESGLPPFPPHRPSWTDLTGPEQTVPGLPQQDFPRKLPSCQTSNTKPAIPSQPVPMPPESHQPQPQPQPQPQVQQVRSNWVPSALPAEAVLVPHTVGQVGSHVFPIASGQYQIRVISYMEVLIPMLPSPAQPSS